MDPAASNLNSLLAVFSETDAKVILGFFVGIPATLSALAAVYAAKGRREARESRRAAQEANAKLKRNGGSSLADDIDWIKKIVAELHVGQASLQTGQKELVGRMDQLEEYVTNPPAQGHIRRRTSA